MSTSLRSTAAIGFGVSFVATLLMAACDVQSVAISRFPDRISLEPSELHVDDGQDADVNASVFDQSGQAFDSVPAGFEFVWWSSDQGVAVVTDNGRVQAIEPGVAEIWVAIVDSSSAPPVADTIAGPGDLADSDAPRASAAVEVVPVPSELVYIAGGDQRAAPNTTLPDLLTVRVIDPEGDGVATVPVDFAVTAGGGTLSDSEIATDSAGFARTIWTLGPTTGVQAVEARAIQLSGSPVVFRAESHAPPQGAARIIIDPDSAEFAALGDTRQFLATVFDYTGNQIPGAEVTWSSMNASIASVDGLGTVEALANGTAGIVATAGEVADTSWALVEQVVASVSVDPMSPTVVVGESVQLSAVAVDSNEVPVAVSDFTWSSSDPGIVSVDATGRATAITTGSASVTAAYGGNNAAAVVTVIAQTPAISEVDVVPDADTLSAIGASTSLSVTAYAPDGSIVSDADIVWASLNTNVAKVDQMGSVISNGVGVALITATAVCCDAADTTQVQVDQLVANVTVSPTDATIQVGEFAQLSVSVADANGHEVPDADVHWTSSDEALATVDSTGKVTGVAAGTATIRALAGTESDSATITVTASGSHEPPAKPATISIQVLKTLTTEVDYRLEWGDVATADDYAYRAGSNDGRWETGLRTTTDSHAAFTAPRDSVDDESYACVRARNAAGVSENRCTTFTVPAQTDGQNSVAAVSVTPSNATIQVGGSTNLKATVTNANGNELTNVGVSWISSDESVATVDGTGTVSGIAEGTATITATAERESDASVITVTDNSSTVLRPVDIPDQSEWTDKGLIVPLGPDGAWDEVIDGAITPSSVVKKDGVYYLYYIGADGRRVDGGPSHRALGVATSTDGTMWAKYSANPIITHHIVSGAEDTHESGVFSAGAELADNGTVTLYFGGMEEKSSGSVDGDVVLATSEDGLEFTTEGDVIRHGANGVIGTDEIFPFGAIEIGGTWYVYYTAKGSVTNWTAVLAIGDSRSEFTKFKTVTGPVPGEFRGGGDPIRLSDTLVLLPIKTAFGAGVTVELRTAATNSMDDFSTLAGTYSWPEVDHFTLFLDREAERWLLFYETSDRDGFHLKTAPMRYK